MHSQSVTRLDESTEIGHLITNRDVRDCVILEKANRCTMIINLVYKMISISCEHFCIGRDNALRKKPDTFDYFQSLTDFTENI